MPLIKSSSRPAFVANLKTELAAGKPRDQALAIAYSVKRRRRAEGGALWGDVGAAMPENIGSERVLDPLATVPKRLMWDLPKEMIENAKATPQPGLRREDYTDVSGPQPVEPMIGNSLETAVNMAGIHAPFVKPGTLGAAGGKLAQPDRMPEIDRILEAERNLKGPPREPAAIPDVGGTAPTPEAGVDVSGGLGGPEGRGVGVDEAARAAERWAGARKPIEGLPVKPVDIRGHGAFQPGPIGKVHDVAEEYMRTNRPEIAYAPPTEYRPIDPEHSAAIAQAYEDMKHTPNDPATKNAYNAMIDETKAQYDAIKASGLKIEPIPAWMPDPYAANPRLAAHDVAENNHLWFFPTTDGFGTVNKITSNPLLRKMGEKIGDHEMTANDMFRVVHDYFGHLKEGHGFRATGEDNAWRSHSAMYSDLARPAMTSETRGQNSYVNYGPHGEKNRTASGADTTYADQKVGLMPDWTMYDKGAEPIYAYHGSPHSFDRFSMDKIGSGEGAQAYGHGLYFAENPKVAKAYRDQLSQRGAWKMNGESVPGTHVDDLMVRAIDKAGQNLTTPDGVPKFVDSHQYTGDVVNGISRLMESGKTISQLRRKPPEFQDDWHKASWNAALDALDQVKATHDINPGQTYKVAIEADPREFANWDKPLSGQRKAMQAFKDEFGGEGAKKFGRMKLGEALSESRRSRGDAVFKRLREAGVPGLSYLDQGSRHLAGGAKTQNHVVFDDSLIKILRKYGIAGVPAAGVAGAASQQEETRAAGGRAVDRAVRRAKGGGVLHVGPIKGATGGRADKRPMRVPNGAYICTADHVSGMGEGNTEAGMKKLGMMFPKSKPSLLRKLKADDAVPIYAADGEFCINPQDILDRWGDLDHGHKSLDAWQTHERQQLIKTLGKLAPPAQD